MLSVESKEWLSGRFENAVLFNEPMNRHTWFNIGGPADALVRPIGIEDLVALVKWCAQNSVPYMIMGNGSNLLVKDGGIRGVVIVTDKCLDKVMTTDFTQDTVSVLCTRRGQTFNALPICHGKWARGVKFCYWHTGNCRGRDHDECRRPRCRYGGCGRCRYGVKAIRENRRTKERPTIVFISQYVGKRR